MSVVDVTVWGSRASFPPEWKAASRQAGCNTSVFYNFRKEALKKKMIEKGRIELKSLMIESWKSNWFLLHSEQTRNENTSTVHHLCFCTLNQHPKYLPALKQIWDISSRISKTVTHKRGSDVKLEGTELCPANGVTGLGFATLFPPRGPKEPYMAIRNWTGLFHTFWI